MKKAQETSLIMPVTPEFVERRILLVRGHKVMLGSDLANLYQVSTKNLNKAVQRNLARFPGDFMFRLNTQEAENLRFQIGTSSWGGSRYLPYVFTELGVAMLSSVLKSDRAVQMNIFIMRAFVKLRESLAAHKGLAEKIKALESEQRKQGKDIGDVIIVVSKLLKEKGRLTPAIGFQA